MRTRQTLFQPMRTPVSRGLPWGFFRNISVWLTLCILGTSFATAGAQVDDDDCLGCHHDASKVHQALGERPLENSVHADLSCTDCHESVTEPEHPRELPPVDCSSCHEDEHEVYKDSVHALTTVDDKRFQPSCKACHGTHDIRGKGDKESLIHPAHLAKTCGGCHSQPVVMRRFGARALDPSAMYEQSVHARVLHEQPEKQPATCVDCHSAHGIYSHLNPKSTFSKFAIPKTCGKCHEKVSSDYLQSVHWDAVRRGHYEAPVCNDCHGEHAAKVPEGGQNPALASSQLCANCHANSVLMSRFGLDAKRFSSYLKTYHGLAVLRGSANAASCIACHEVHAIRSKLEPRSTVHEANLQKTCGKCHQSAGADFAKVSVHPLNLEERNPIAHIFKVSYLWLIGIVIGGMLLHNAIIFYFYLRERWLEHRGAVQVRRFTTFQVVQHFLLLVSFTVLALTGFALVYSESAWAQVLASFGIDEALRSLIHRIAGVVLIISSALQAVYFVASRNGRKDALALIPRWTDVTGFVRNMRFYLRLDDRRPEFGRYDYTEKAEYLALIWGTLVMALTGLVLWFPEQALKIFPVWMFEVCEVIHFFEAVLAVSAIIVWHLFFTVFHPAEYPMSMTWLDGKLSQEKQEHHHPLEHAKPEEDE